jgi:hypothetical protein
MDKEKCKDISCSSHTVISLSLLSDSHGPGTPNMKSIANVNDMWLMTRATFQSRPTGLPPRTKPLNVPKHFNSFSPLSLALRRAVFPLHICQDQEREQGISRLLQVVTLGWSVHSLGQGTI